MDIKDMEDVFWFDPNFLSQTPGLSGLRLSVHFHPCILYLLCVNAWKTNTARILMSEKGLICSTPLTLSQTSPGLYVCAVQVF